MYFFHYTEAVKPYSQKFFVVLPCNGRNTPYFLSGLVELTYAGLETYSWTKILTIRYSLEILGGATFYSFLVCVTGLGSLVLPWDGSSCCPVMEEVPSQGRPPLHGSWIQLILLAADVCRQLLWGHLVKKKALLGPVIVQIYIFEVSRAAC